MNEKSSVLIVDDEIGPREALRLILRPYYDVYTAKNGHEALELLIKQDVDLVTLDLKMPGLQGSEVLKEIKRLKNDIEVIIITGFGSLRSAIDGIRFGAADYLMKPFNVAEILSVISNILEKKKVYDKLRFLLDDLSNLIKLDVDITDIRKKFDEHSSVFDKVKDLLLRSLKPESSGNCINNLEVIRVLADVLDSKDPYTHGHSSRVNYYANLLAQKFDLNQDDQRAIQIASYLHDIGKIGIDNKYILKNGRLSQSEQQMVRRHCEIAVDLISPLGLSKDVISIIRHHHEFFDGSGYPDGIKGEEISLLTRIVSISDAFDSMIVNLPYRKALPIEDAVSELKRCSGTQFDPKLVIVFIEIIQTEREKILSKIISLPLPSILPTVE